MFTNLLKRTLRNDPQKTIKALAIYFDILDDWSIISVIVLLPPVNGLENRNISICEKLPRAIYFLISSAKSQHLFNVYKIIIEWKE